MDVCSFRQSATFDYDLLILLRQLSVGKDLPSSGFAKSFLTFQFLYLTPCQSSLMCTVMGGIQKIRGRPASAVFAGGLIRG